MTISVVELIMRLGASVLLGSMIGYERELRAAGRAAHPPAGLAGVGHVYARIIAIPFSPELSRHGRRGILAGGHRSDRIQRRRGDRVPRRRRDPALGFRVEGLTTAASLWLVAAVGMASGAGLYVLAVATTVIALFGLVGLHFVEAGFKNVLNLRSIDSVGELLSRSQLQEALAPLGADVKDVDYAHDLALNRSRIHVDIRLPRHDLEEGMVKIFERMPGVQSVRVRRPTG